MSEEDIDGIASVFSDAMGGDPDFPFTILQPAGGASRALVVPFLSSSFRWTVSTVTRKNAKVPICILAGADLKVCMSYNMLLWKRKVDIHLIKIQHNMNHVQSVKIIAIPPAGVWRICECTPQACSPCGIFPKTSSTAGMMYTSWPWFI